MKRSSLMIAASVLGSLSVASADVVESFDPSVGITGNGLRGYRIDAPSSDTSTNPFGWALLFSGAPKWSFGVNKSLQNNSNDCFITSHQIGANQFRLRSDTGQLSIGRAVGQNVGGAQVQITGGDNSNPLSGVAIGVFGDRNGVSLSQAGTNAFGAPFRRTKINFNNDFHIGSDWNQANQKNFYIADVTDINHVYPFIVSADDDKITMGYATQINAALTLNGFADLKSSAKVTGSFQHSGNLLGFYDKAPVERPVITGCRCDGTALADLLQKLQAMGLIVDQTTP